MSESIESRKVRELQAFRLKIMAIYHNCKSSECFARADAMNADDAERSHALSLQADAYCTIAGQLNANLKIS